MSIKKFVLNTLIVVAALLICGAFLSRSCVSPPVKEATTVVRDTLIVRDTIYPPIPEPEIRVIVRYDTIPAGVPTDTSHIVAPPNVIIPITQSVYMTEDYRAVVEGYKPRLVSMELYPKTTVINNTVTKYKSPRWVISVGPGVGYGSKGVEPYIGINAGFVLWSR